MSEKQAQIILSQLSPGDLFGYRMPDSTSETMSVYVLDHKVDGVWWARAKNAKYTGYINDADIIAGLIKGNFVVLRQEEKPEPRLKPLTLEPKGEWF